MTHDHAERARKSITNDSKLFDRVCEAKDWEGAEKLWQRLLASANMAIREAVAASTEADALATELLVYRPVRTGLPAAPALDGFVYVFTAKTPWVCVAKNVRKRMAVNPEFNLWQEFYIHEQTTVCGKLVTFPVRERFTSGGWPRLHELCPECVIYLKKAAGMLQ